MTADKDDKAAPAQDDDRTQFLPTPMPPRAAEPGVAEDDDRTQFVPAAPPSADDDRTQFFQPSGAPPVPEGQIASEVDRTKPPLTATDLPPLSPPRSAAIAAAAVNVSVGTLINNNYQVTQVLKSGGMGEVYRGVEIGTGDPVAIKAILPELAEDEKAGLLFKREARTLRQLADEAIVRYYNYVHDRELNRYFLVMEFIEGVPLSDFIASHGAITSAAGRTLLKRLAKGLAKAHAQDVVHRDLSPDNVMLPDGLVAEARLIDFGIAKSNVVKEGTMAGQFAGKFKYVAPEQLGHYNGDIGPGTDIYGLALLVCAAVIGKPLDMGSSIVEAVQSRMSVPDLSAVPVELRPILAHMLEPNPAHRPASMEDVQRLLERPEQIPAQYRSGLPLPPAMERTQRETTAGPTFKPTPGLQVPGTMAPMTLRTSTLPPVPAAPVKADKTGSRVLVLMLAVFVAILGGAGWYAWNEGLIGGAGAPRQPGAVTAVPGLLPPVQITSREGFLATFDTGPCTYAARVATGTYAGMIEGFSVTGSAPFTGLPAAYETAFGSRPGLQPRPVTPQQCAALEFARALQGRDLQPVQMLLSTDTLISGETLEATLTLPDAASVWTVLISPVGAVYNLTGRVSEAQGGQRGLGFGLNLNQGSDPAPQLVLAVAGDAPLARAAAMRDGSGAAELLPAVLAEITNRGTGASAALGWVMLTPPTVDEPAQEVPPAQPAQE